MFRVGDCNGWKLGMFKPVISVMVDSAQCTFLEVLGTL